MKEQFLERWGQLRDWLHALEVRERGIILGGILAVIGMLWFQGFLEPVLKERKMLNDQASSLRTEIQGLEAVKAGSLQRLKNDPNEELRAEIAKIQVLGDALDRQVKQLSASWITPREMAKALRSVLVKRGNLDLQSLTSDVPRSLSESVRGGSSRQGDGDAVTQEIFVHGMEIVLEGAFFDVLSYLESLEEIPWKFQWELLKYEVAEYPKASVTIRVQTYSAEKGWIGV